MLTFCWRQRFWICKLDTTLSAS